MDMITGMSPSHSAVLPPHGAFGWNWGLRPIAHLIFGGPCRHRVPPFFFFSLFFGGLFPPSGGLD